MAVNQSYVGTDANPITKARVALQMSGPSLAKRLGFSRQYISRAEQGTYSKLNPALLKWTANASDVTVGKVELSYEKFQKAQRRATVERVDPVRLARGIDKLSPGGMLFERWRSTYWNSPTAFSIALCVHPDSVTKYEEGITRQMPKQIREALEEVNLLSEDWF